MKMLPTNVITIESEGLLSLLGQKVLIFCFNYFYYGELIGVNDICIKLKDVYKVFETGSFSEDNFSDAQNIAPEWYVQISSIESFGKSKKHPL